MHRCVPRRLRIVRPLPAHSTCSMIHPARSPVHALIQLMLKLVVATLLSALPLVSIAADVFPTRPVRLMVPYPAGGPNDVLARMVGGKLGEGWGQQVVIENRPGAGGN